MRNSLLLLGELSDADMDWLRQAGEKISLPADSVLIEQGHPIPALYLLLNGTLLVKASAPGQTEARTVARLTTGEVIGEMSFVDQRPPSATVVAETDAVLLAVPQALLLERTETDLAFGKRFYRGLAFCLSNRLRLMNVNSPQADVPRAAAPSNAAANESVARLRLDSLIASAR